MAPMTETKPPVNDDVIGRLAEKGEQAMQRLAELPGGTKALQKLNDLRARVDDLSKRVRGLEAMEKRLAAVESRVAKLEGSNRRASSSKAKSATKKPPEKPTEEKQAE